jgi:hypothetical protein
MAASSAPALVDRTTSELIDASRSLGLRGVSVSSLNHGAFGLGECKSPIEMDADRRSPLVRTRKRGGESAVFTTPYKASGSTPDVNARTILLLHRSLKVKITTL